MAELELYTCKNCGEQLDIREIQNGVLKCKYCGSVFTLPKEETTPAALAFLRSGEHDLDACEFDKAYVAYGKAAELDKNEPEAYWGMALAKFKVQYLKDEVNNRLQPICHEVTDKKFSDDPDYMRAFMKATPGQREEYEKRAKDIDYIQSEFSKLEKTGLDYDCFICVKVTGENGEFTEDSKDADYIYRLLKDKGYKPFYSEYEIRNKQGADYEAHILYALYKSECMLIVCRDKNYLYTKWVKNEYARFLKLVNDEEKESDSITFVYHKKAIDKLPDKKGKIQGIDFSQPFAFQQIIEFVENHTPEAKRKREEAAAAKIREEEEQKRRFAEQQRIIEERQKEFEEQQRIVREETEKQRRALEEQQRQFAEQLEKMKSSSAAVSGGLSDDELFERMERARAERERKKQEEERVAREMAEAVRKVREERIAKEKAEREWREENEPNLYCYNIDEFAIVGTELIKYKGSKANVKIPQGVTSIDERTFWNCKNLTNITIPDSVTSIGNLAFSGCTSLESIKIPDSVTSFGYGAFCNCSGLTSIEIHNGVTIIGERAFYGCSSLTSIKIPESVTLIGNDAFRNCNKLVVFCECEAEKHPQKWSEFWKDKSLRVAWGGRSIEEEERIARGKAEAERKKQEEERKKQEEARIARENWIKENDPTISCYNSNEFEIDGTVFKKYTGNKSNVIVPQGVTSIGNSAFNGCTNLTSITIPNSVTSIGSYAFSGCTSLESIKIPHSVTSIGDWAFINCTSLTGITIPDSVTSIGDWAFHGCTAEINWGDKPAINEIKYSFRGYEGKKLTIPNSVTSIGNSAFNGCTNLTSITIPNSVTSIGSDAFRDCTSLKEITIPNSVTSIGERAFINCTSLTGITIPDSVTSIGDWAFHGCTAEINWGDKPAINEIKYSFRGYEGKKLTIPNSVTSIGAGAFGGCNLESISLPFVGNGSNETRFGFVFSASKYQDNSYVPSLLKTVVITGGKSIGNGAFCYCTSLESIILGNCVTSIGNNAFRSCKNLKKVIIPNSVTSIGYEAFSDCKNLKSIIIPDSVTFIGYSAFDGCPNLITIYCKANKKPEDWDKDWNVIKSGNILTKERAKVVWGYKGK